MFFIYKDAEYMEDNHIKLTFPSLFDETVRKFGKSNAYSFVGEEPVTWETANRRKNALCCIA